MITDTENKEETSPLLCATKDLAAYSLAVSSRCTASENGLSYRIMRSHTW